MKRERIQLRKGKAKELAKHCGVSTETVRRALMWENDTDAQRLVRQRAKQYGFIKEQM